MLKIKQYTEAAEQIEELKDKNLELYEANMLLEEKQAELKHVKKLKDNPDNTDEEHIKEMLGTQNLLREEMKEKEFFKEQAQTTIQQLLELQTKSSAKEKELETEAQRRKLEVQLLEEKNSKMREQIAD